MKQGTLMLIRDHINMMGVNPLRGANDERFGARFPDMTEVYCTEFQQIANTEAKNIAAEKKLPIFLRRGSYCALSGPTYETPAEIRMVRMIGADAVGMSTVPEAIVARHMGLEVLGISCITNMAAGVLPQPLDHAEVMETANRVSAEFMQLLEGIIGRL